MTFHVRLVSVPDRTRELVEALAADAGVSNLLVLSGGGALVLRAQRIIWGARERAGASLNAPGLANRLPRQRRSGDG